jgi:hypothetical protein
MTVKLVGQVIIVIIFDAILMLILIGSTRKREPRIAAYNRRPLFDEAMIVLPVPDHFHHWMTDWLCLF